MDHIFNFRVYSTFNLHLIKDIDGHFWQVRVLRFFCVCLVTIRIAMRISQLNDHMDMVKSMYYFGKNAKSLNFCPRSAKRVLIRGEGRGGLRTSNA